MEEFPRLASFNATSNMTDILADPSGNRRFLGVELTGPIDVSERLNYEQLYAQAMEALDHGEKPYFDAEQTAIKPQTSLFPTRYEPQISSKRSKYEYPCR